MEEYKFPEGFKWGSATSAHQVEGGNHNDWSEWEGSAKRVEQLKKEGKNPDDFISGKACDSYNRYEEDFDIAKSLNQNIHRLSIEWSRIEPKEGRFDHEAMLHYVNVIKALRARGLEPMVTLWHFTNPIWFAEKGGFLNVDSPTMFTRYVKYVVDNLRDRVGLWITFNEPTTIYSTFAYLMGVWPPHHKNLLSMFTATNNFTKAHILAYQEIKKIYDVPPALAETSLVSHNVMVGFAENNAYVVISRNWFKGLAGRIYNYFRNLRFISKVAPYCDFIGLNYYNLDRKIFKNFDVLPKQQFVPSKKWELYPKGIYYRLMDLKQFKKPIFITENGIPNVIDGERISFIKDHLYWVLKAIHGGVDVRGYLYWSLLDNFEIVDGFPVRFGLVEVDFETFERKVRPSALEYAKICKTNQLEIDS